MNLVPTVPGTTPSYWCTWGVQNFSLLHNKIKDADDFAHNAFGYAMDNLSEARLFEQPGWASHPYFEAVRPDLYLMFDVGWDTLPNMQYPQERWRLGSMLVNDQKFPSCTGTPVERLHKLNQLVKKAGWRGAALWVSPQLPGDNQVPNQWREDIDAEVYWRERARWSKEAGIEYWKVDIGARGLSLEFRQMLTQIAHEEAPGLVVEHGRNTGPLNDVRVPWEETNGQNKGRFETWGQIYSDSVKLVTTSDMFRTYDVTPQLSVATTLDRVAQLLQAASSQMRPGRQGLLNCEDEPYLAAGLGCAIGVMRHPLWQERPDIQYDPANYKRRIDEVTRAIRWQRIAPAFGAGETSVTLDEVVLTDSWKFKRGETWADFVIGQTIEQSAPARVARGTTTPLPLVKAQSNTTPPFVVTACHPNGTISVATLPRTLPGTESIGTPLADVTIAAGDGTHPIGIFGHFASLTLEFSQSIKGKQVWAQDLAGEQAVEVWEGMAEGRENELVLSGALIEQIGLMASTPGDLSEPGLVLILA